MSGRIVVDRLSLENFRNIESAVLEPARRFNLLYGDNGHGKTSLIEALYVLCTTRSFRTSHLGEVVRRSAVEARIACRAEALGLPREQRAVVSTRGRSFLADGKRPKRALDYARLLPVVAFHPGDLTLASGPAGARRTLLDRVGLHVDPAGVEARLLYQEAQRARQKALVERGTRALELDAYESVMALHGGRFSVFRRRAAEAVERALVPAFSRMASADLAVGLSFVPGGTEDPAAFAKELLARRPRDIARGAATFGPHRAELDLTLGGASARTFASQGQQRLLALALKLAELRAVAEATGLEPILLLDDVSSELDPERTRAVFSLLNESRSQVFVTTTRAELFDTVRPEAGERADFRVVGGRVTRVR